jgi:predicted nucleic acid-binding protein
MIIVDTSIWIEFLKGNFKHSDLLISSIENREVLMLECITGELLQGVKSVKEREIILQYWKNLPQIPMESLWVKAGLLSSKEKLISKGIGLIDAVLIIGSTETNSKLWTLDKRILGFIKPECIFTP